MKIDDKGLAKHKILRVASSSYKELLFWYSLPTDESVLFPQNVEVIDNLGFTENDYHLAVSMRIQGYKYIKDDRFSNITLSALKRLKTLLPKSRKASSYERIVIAMGVPIDFVKNSGIDSVDILRFFLTNHSSLIVTGFDLAVATYFGMERYVKYQPYWESGIFDVDTIELMIDQGVDSALASSLSA